MCRVQIASYRPEPLHVQIERVYIFPNIINLFIFSLRLLLATDYHFTAHYTSNTGNQTITNLVVVQIVESAKKLAIFKTIALQNNNRTEK